MGDVDSSEKSRVLNIPNAATHCRFQTIDVGMAQEVLLCVCTMASAWHLHTMAQQERESSR